MRNVFLFTLKTSTIQKTSSYQEIPTPRFVDIILAGGEQADEAMFFLLHHRLKSRLHERFQVFERRLLDDFDDVVEDFFLYLREGKDSRHLVAYPSLHNIQNPAAFETWVLNTFRNYLSVRVAKEERLTTRLSDNPNLQPADDSSLLADERKLAIASHLIAYAHQTFHPRSRFILLRTLLSLLDKQRAMPNAEVAQALGMTDISYRVTVHRIKSRLSKYRNLLLHGVPLTLDEPHQQMAQHINDNFTLLYPTLMHYYSQALEGLNSGEAIQHLRQEHLDTTGLLLHEPDTSYAPLPSVDTFWNRLSRFLIA